MPKPAIADRKRRIPTRNWCRSSGSWSFRTLGAYLKILWVWRSNARIAQWPKVVPWGFMSISRKVFYYIHPRPGFWSKGTTRAGLPWRSPSNHDCLFNFLGVIESLSNQLKYLPHYHFVRLPIPHWAWIQRPGGHGFPTDSAFWLNRDRLGAVLIYGARQNDPLLPSLNW